MRSVKGCPMSALGQEQTWRHQGLRLTAASNKRADVRGTMLISSRATVSYQCGLVHWARYMIAAIESGLRSTMYASSSLTRYKKGLSPVASPDFLFPLTWPQMISKGGRVAGLISTNSADAGFSILTATATFAFSKTGSDNSTG